jgi:beta-lactamase superfamily II metal-dependent hydrolase
MATSGGGRAPRRPRTRKKPATRKPATRRRRKGAAAAARPRRRARKTARGAPPAGTPQSGQPNPADSASKASAPGKTPAAASSDRNAVGPNGLRVRMFRVGFGDFFLLTVQTAVGLKHILVDCGVHAGDIGSIKEAVAQMAKDTGRNLALVIMTHRHADHISGFATCKDVFSQFTVEQVWMSWFENPDDKRTAAFQASLAGVAQQLAQALKARRNPDDRELGYMAENITGTALAFGRGNANDVALGVLHGGFKNKPPIGYYKAGDTPTLPQELAAAGLTAQILGPPHDLALVAQMNGKNEQYLAANDPSVSRRIHPFERVFRIGGTEYPKAAFRYDRRQTIERSLTEAQPDILAAKARQADNTLNNQSLVVLFTFRRRHLLFAGDAQWGNWENFLYGGKFGASGHAALTEASKAILGAVDFYKVGHHGSTNATPKDALGAMRDGCVAMCSTEPGCYGKASTGTEVPRMPLLDAIEKKTNNQLARSDQIGAGKKKPTAGLDALGKPFSTRVSSGPDQLYIDYKL